VTGNTREWLDFRFAGISVAAAGMVALVLAIPTAIIANPLFTRMTPTEPEQYVFWIATSLLTGALFTTYLHPHARTELAGAGAGAGLLGLFAIGCPVCNKLVVGLLGASGALSYFAPIQPVLGALAVGVAGYALFLRLKDVETPSCSAPVAHHSVERA
jgi:hypothetical protein